MSGANVEEVQLIGGQAADVIGSEQADVIVGNRAANRLDGGGGNDFLDGGAGPDVLIGGAGDDTYVVDESDEIDTAVPDPGTDTVRAFVSYTLGPEQELLILLGEADIDGTGNNDHNVVTGNTGNNTLDGGAGNDTLDATAGGVDTLLPGEGDDTYLLEPWDIIAAGADPGVDTVRVDGSWELGPEQEHLHLVGEAHGNATGNAADNDIQGNAGDNRLDGGGGADTLRGSAGDDVFLYDPADVLYDGGVGSDTVVFEDAGLAVEIGVNLTVVDTENFDIRGSGANSFIFHSASGGLSEVFNLVTIEADADDSVHLSGEWVQTIPPVTAFPGYEVFDQGNYRVLVSADAQINVDALRGVVANIAIVELSEEGVTRFIDAGGTPLSAARDHDQDGFADFTIGNHVVWGGQAFGAEAIDLGAAEPGIDLLTVIGATDEVRSLLAGTDYNGDGLADLVAAQPLADYVFPEGVRVDAGMLRLADGDGTRGLGELEIESAATLSFQASTVETARVGYELEDLGDLDGDGFSDFGVSGWNAGGANPTLANGFNVQFLVLGDAPGSWQDGDLINVPAHKMFWRSFNYEPQSFDGIGDFQGDGLADYLRVTTTDSVSSGVVQRSFVYELGFGEWAVSDTPGANLPRLSLIEAELPEGTIRGPAAGVGDLNADGLDDIAISLASESGALLLLPGQTGLAVSADLQAPFALVTEFSGTRITAAGPFLSVDAGGDFNGDGLDDAIIGGVGEAWVLYGKAGGWGESIDLEVWRPDLFTRIDGGEAYPLLGDRVAGAGDVNGDGFDDLLIGAGADIFLVYGGDTTAAVDAVGTPDDDAHLGTPADEVLIGGIGNDMLNGGGGADVLKGGAGDDILVFHAGAERYEGDLGTDTLMFSGADQVLDFTALLQGRFEGLEIIDLTGTGDNTLVLSALDVLNLPDSSIVLRIDGDTGDSVTATDGRITADGADPVDIAGELYTSWSVGTQSLLIDADITQNIS